MPKKKQVFEPENGLPTGAQALVLQLGGGDHLLRHIHKEPAPDEL